MRIKLSDIAKKAGVSVSTVSRALNHPEMVKETTRNKVLKVINEVNVAENYLDYKNYMAKTERYRFNPMGNVYTRPAV